MFGGWCTVQVVNWLSLSGTESIFCTLSCNLWSCTLYTHYTLRFAQPTRRTKLQIPTGHPGKIIDTSRNEIEPSFELTFRTPVLSVMSGCATRLAKSKQPLSHSAREAGATQAGRAADAATHPLSHSEWLAEWLVQPLWQSRVAGAATQPLSHSEWLSGWSSHSGRVADWLEQPLSHSVIQSGWVAGEPLECKQYYPDLIFLRSG